jgi:hypothetical protein
MRELEGFDFKHYSSGPSDHLEDALDGASELMGSSGISRNSFIWVLVLVDVFPIHPTLIAALKACKFKHH